ncbi:MAG: complex I NDUFA9 subunit family protein [Cucumibacter sp.]
MALSDEKRVTIFGGSGFVGRRLVQLLARRDWRIRVAVRRPDLAGHVRPLGRVGQIAPVQANVRYPESVAAAISGADVVINLTGILNETGRQKFRAVHTMGAKNVAAAAKAAGVKRLVHMSALGADENSPSAYQRSKALGEAEVLAAFKDAVVLRPSIQFGEGDGFFTRFATLARWLPVLPLIGGNTRFQPVHVGDVAEALARAAEGMVKDGKVYELGGPDTETMADLIRRILRETGRHNPLLPMPRALASFGAAFTGLLPHPLLTRDQVTQLYIDNVVSDGASRQKRTFQAFGIDAATMEAILPTYLWRFRPHGQFDRPGARVAP